MIQDIYNLNNKWYVKHDPEDCFEKDGIMYDPHFSPFDWEEITVPSHWQNQGFDYQGVVWYYKYFKIDNLEEKFATGKAYLKFEGVDYLAQVWLNGVFLGVHEGDFDSFYYEVSNYLQEENAIFVKVNSEVDTRPEFKEVIKGGIYHWDCLPIEQKGLKDCPEVPSAANPQYPNPVINPGGIWKPVYLEFSSPYKLEEIQTESFFENQEKVYLKIKGNLYHRGDSPVRLKGKIRLSPANFDGKDYYDFFVIDVVPGKNYISREIVLDNPALWWTWDLGKPNLYKFELNLADENNEVVDFERLVGIRKVEKGENWELYLNGKRFFARGTNYLSNQFLSLVTEEIYDQDLEMMLEANMNMVRLFSHMENEYFYQQCDKKGILIFQDLPFQWGYNPDPFLIERARDLAARFVKKLFNHPSIFLWCCHSESRFHDYNKLDKVLESEVKRIDPQRPVWRDSVIMTDGNPPEYFKNLDEFEGYVNNHLSVHWVGWYWGEINDAEYYNPLFITEFGTQSVPCIDSLRKFIDEKDLWPPNWDEWRYRGFQTNIYEKNIGDYPDTLEELIAITQEYQCSFYKEHIEALRRKKFNNVNGLIQFHFVNTWPAIDWSIIDYYRVPKKAYYTVKKAFNPVLLSFTGDFKENGVQISVWVVNDLYQEFKDVVLEWKVLVGDRVVLKEESSIDKIYKNKADIYLDKFISVEEKKICVQGTLYRQGRELSTNENILTPLKDFTAIETSP